MEEFVLLTSEQMKGFAERVAEELKVLKATFAYSSVTISTFADKSNDVHIPVNVRKKNVYLVHSFSNPNDGYMQLFLLNDALKRASAEHIVNVLPDIPYSRKDWKDRPRVPIAAKLFAQLTEASGATRVITNDLHAAQIQGFYDIAVDNLESERLLAEYVKKEYSAQLGSMVVVAPDTGRAKLARNFARRLGLNIAIIDKRRLRVNEAEVMHIVGDVSGKVCFMLDDMIDTGGTLVEGAKALLKNGAIEVYAACTHAILSEKNGIKAEDKILSSIKEIIITDSIPRSDTHPRIRVMSLAGLYANVIFRTETGKSVSELFC